MKIIILIIILFLNIIYGCKEFILDYEEIESTGCIGTTTVVLFKNYQQFKTFTISPDPLDIKTTVNEKSIKFDYGKTYTLSYTSLNCTTINTKIFTPTTPSTLPSSFSITQPKCSFSKGTITLKNKNPSSQYTIYSDSSSTVPIITLTGTSFDLDSGNYLIRDSTQSTDCDASFTIDPTPSLNIPIIDIQSAYCYKDNGSILVTNEGSYSSIQLVSSNSNTEIESTSSGKFTSLPSADYVLSLVSTACGIQKIQINVPSANPRLDITFTNSNCPSKPTITVSIDDKDSVDPGDIFQMTLGGIASSSTLNQLSPTIPASTSSLPFTFDYKGCSIQFQLPIPKAIMNLNYDIKDSFETSLLNDCNSKSSITLSYDKNEITGLKVNNSSGSPVSVNQDGTYPLEMNDRLSITSDCYLDPTYIEIPQPEPLYKVEGGIDTSCFGNTSIQIYNYLDFSDIYLEYSLDTSKTIKMDSDGYFRNIFRTSYNLVYKYCSTSSISKKSIQLYDNTITPEFTITSTPSSNHNIDCQSLVGSVTLTFTQSDNTQSNPITALFNSNSLNNVQVQVNDYCKLNLNLNSKLNLNNFNYILNDKPKIKINNTTCLYSNDGSIIINHDSLLFDTILIGDKQYIYNQVDNTYGNLNIGEYSVKVLISNQDNHYCGGILSDLGIVTISSKDSTFKITTTVNPVTDCSSSSGSIQVSNYQSFSSLNIGSTSATNGLFDNLASNIYTLEFASSTCSGKLPIYVPTSNQNILLSNIIQQPTCYASDGSNSPTGDGIVSFTLLDSTGQNIIAIDKVLELNSNSQSVLSTISTSPGNKEFIILSNSCSYRKSITLELSDPKLSYISTFPYNCIDNFESGYISSDNIGVTIDSIKLLSSQGTTLNILNGHTIANMVKGEYGAVISWNSVCKKTIVIKTQQPNEIEKPILTFIQDSCMSDYNLQLRIENSQLYSLLSINDQIASDGGIFYKLPIGSGTLKYIDSKSKCSSSIDFNYDYKLSSTISSSISSSLKSMVSETCHGSCNGYLNYSTISLPTTNYYSNIIIKENSKSYLLPTKSFTSNDKQSYGISTNTLLFNSILKSNPICSIITPIVYLSYEPELRSLADQCTPYIKEETSSSSNQSSSFSSSSSSSSNTTIEQPKVNIEEFLLYVSDKDNSEINLPSSLKVKYNLLNIKTQESIQSQSINSAQYHDLEYGEYKLTASIDNKICKRNIVHNLLIDSETSTHPYLVMVDSENYCEKVHFTPSDVNATYSYYIRNSTNDLLFNYTLMVGSFSSDLLVLNDNYTVQIDQYSKDNKTIDKSCTIAFTVSRKCPKEKDSKVKLILALVLGVGVSAIILVYVIYKIRERSMRREEKQHELHHHEYDNQSIQQHHFIGE